MAISSPNYTPFPNELLDKWLPVLSPAEWCVLSYLVRHTFGYHRRADTLTYQHFLCGITRADGSAVDGGCGLASFSSIKKALDRLQQVGLVKVTRGTRPNGATARSSYELCIEEVPSAAVAVAQCGITESVMPASGSTESVMPALHLVECLGATESVMPIKETKENHKENQDEKKTRGGVHAPAPRAPAPASAPASQHEHEHEHERDDDDAPAGRAERKKPLRALEPDVHASREAIKARALDLAGQSWAELSRTRQGYLNADSEALARKCADTEEALACMQAVYDFAWKDGRHPYRTPFKLSKVTELLKAYRQGDLGACPRMTEQEEREVERALSFFNDHIRPVLDDEEDRFKGWALGGIQGFGLAHWLGAARCVASDPRQVGSPHATPDTITRLVAFWEDNGQPRTWRELEERKKRHIMNGRR